MFLLKWLQLRGCFFLLIIFIFHVCLVPSESLCNIICSFLTCQWFKGSKPLKLLWNARAASCNSRQMSMAWAWIRVVSYAGYFWFGICLLHGDVNPLCVLCLTFFLHSPQAVINIKPCKSCSQFWVARALSVPTALSGPEQPPQPTHGPGLHCRAVFPCLGDIVGCCSPAPHGPAHLWSLLSCTLIKFWLELAGAGSCAALPDVRGMCEFTGLGLSDFLNYLIGTALVLHFNPLPEHLCLRSGVWVSSVESFVSSVEDLWWDFIVLTQSIEIPRTLHCIQNRNTHLDPDSYKQSSYLSL